MPATGMKFEYLVRARNMAYGPGFDSHSHSYAHDAHPRTGQKQTFDAICTVSCYFNEALMVIEITYL